VTLPSHILIVDDDEAGQLALEGLLSLEGYQLSVASSGQEAIQQARHILPDLILLDVMMPGMDGFEVCQYLRQDSVLAEVPVILVTTLDSQESRVRGIEAGADDFISKPFDRVELRARVKTVTRLNRYRRLLAERQKFEWVVEAADEGYVLLDAAGMVCYANTQARLYLELAEVKMAAEDSPLCHFLQRVQQFYQCQPAEAWVNWPELPAQSNIPRYLVRAETQDAPIFWLQVDVFRLHSHREDWLIRLRDINEKVLEQQRMWTFERLVSHKLRTPLTGLTALQLVRLRLSKMNADPELIELIEAAEESFERLKHQTSDILAYLDAPLLLKSQEGCWLNELSALFIETAEALTLTAECDWDHDPEKNNLSGQLSLSKQAIRAIFQELLENARKFHPHQSPHIILQITPLSTQRVRLMILDNGRRLSPVELARVWTPYYQCEKNFTGEVSGMGLGLPTVASLVWSAGGSCRMLNRSDVVGVGVELILPVHLT
jgi:two-component system, cell cycle response regulator